jgi:hypothetical protein
MPEMDAPHAQMRRVGVAQVMKPKIRYARPPTRRSEAVLTIPHMSPALSEQRKFFFLHFLNPLPNSVRNPLEKAIKKWVRRAFNIF